MAIRDALRPADEAEIATQRDANPRLREAIGRSWKRRLLAGEAALRSESPDRIVSALDAAGARSFGGGRPRHAVRSVDLRPRRGTTVGAVGRVRSEGSLAG